MRGLTALGVVLVVLGVAALLFGHFSYTDSKPAAKVGPLQVNVEQQHHVSIPTIAGIVVLMAGLGVILIGRRSA
jgi:hypothetical protein